MTQVDVDIIILLLIAEGREEVRNEAKETSRG
jgi:hypothetical protein